MKTTGKKREYINPAWLPPLRNFNDDTTAYRWFRLEYYGCYDVDIVECGVPRDIGTEEHPEPAWLEHEDRLLSILYETMRYNGIKNMDTADWAIQQGLSPGQVFLVAFHEPTYTTTHSYYDGDDVDITYHCRVVRKMPKPDRSAMLAWESVLKRINLLHEREQRRHEHFRRLRLALTHRWKIRIDYHGRDSFGTFGTTREIIEMTLYCEIPGDLSHTRLAIGRSGDTVLLDGRYQKEAANYTVTFWRLVESFMKHHPEADVSPVLALAQASPLENKKIEVSRWDYLRLQNRKDHPEVGPIDELP